MHGSFREVLQFFLHLGAWGLVLLTVADDSFLFLPVGGDLLAVLLIARDHAHFPLYVLAGAAGSTVGVVLLDFVCRKGGEAGLGKVVKPKLHAYLKAQMEKRAAIVLVIACFSPPPFPFGAAIGVASALQYPRARLLSVVFLARAARFVLVGWAAIAWGRNILRVVNSSGFLWFMGIFIAICVIGSVFEVVRWVRRGR